MAEVATLPTVYEKPDLPVTLAREVGQILRTLIESPHLSMVSAVALCELLQWVKISDYVPGHWENYLYQPPGGWQVYPGTRWVPEQPRRMLLSQELSTTLETAIISSTVIKSVAGDAGPAGGGISGLLSQIISTIRK